LSRSLLVVDDEMDICEFVQDVAEDMAFLVTTTTTTYDFDAVYVDGLDAIILDLSMPDQDGIEVIRYLAEADCRAALVLMSGLDSGVLATAERLARERGLTVIGALTKPIEVATLEELLDQVPSADGKTVQSATVLTEPSGFIPAEELALAIREGQIVPWFQPRIQLEDMTFVGVEALARWQHPDQGMIPPDRFIQLAENNNLIDALTDTMVNQSLEAIAGWQQMGLTVDVSINYAAPSLADLNLPDDLSRRVSSHGLTANRVTVEITESSVLTELQNSLDVLTRLRMKGFQLSIDDFGTGFSSMQQLQNIPFTELKIDQSFVKRALGDADAKAIVETTVELGRRLDMSVIAEGVEDRETLEFLHRCDCEQIQGYFIAKPMPGDQIPAWSDDWTSVAEALKS
jgi:EAL domain-containing protein (putative c-di-GMP-specific phosphodiesterase class I)/ActR/RegA family two-component response regulator